jgi:hypothetical protein
MYVQQGRYIAHQFEFGWEVGVIKALSVEGLEYSNLPSTLDLVCDVPWMGGWSDQDTYHKRLF